MAKTEDQVGEAADGGTEERLREEIEELKRRLEQQQRQMDAHRDAAKPPHPSRRALWLLALVALALVGFAFFRGYGPLRARQEMIAAEAKTQEEALPVVNVTAVARQAARGGIVLPGSIQAITEAPILARADG